MAGAPGDRGLDADGYIRREGSLDRVAGAFAPVVAAFRSGVAGAFGVRLHSAYLYGSIPRGTAVPGRSDLDGVILLTDEPSGDDRAAAGRLADGLDRHDAVDGAGLLLWSAARVLAPAERYDLAGTYAAICFVILVSVVFFMFTERVERWLRPVN